MSLLRIGLGAFGLLAACLLVLVLRPAQERDAPSSVARVPIAELLPDPPKTLDQLYADPRWAMHGFVEAGLFDDGAGAAAYFEDVLRLPRGSVSHERGDGREVFLVFMGTESDVRRFQLLFHGLWGARFRSQLPAR